MQFINQKRETIDFHVNAAQHIAKPDTGSNAAHQAGGNNQNNQLRVMDANINIIVAERLQGGDLFALGVDRSAHDNIQQKSGDTDEDRGEYFRTGLKLLEFLAEKPVRYLVFARIGAETAVSPKI